MNLLLTLLQDASPPDHGHQVLQQSATGFFGMGIVALIFLVSLVTLGGLFVLTQVVAPDLTARCAGALRQRSLLSFGVGLGVSGFLAVSGAVVSRTPPLAFIWLLVTALLAIVGIAAASEDVGRRLFWISGREGNRVTHILAGWLVVGCASGVPFLGWFVVGPYIAISGFGSFVVGLITGRGTPATPPAGDPDLVIR